MQQPVELFSHAELTPVVRIHPGAPDFSELDDPGVNQLSTCNYFESTLRSSQLCCF